MLLEAKIVCGIDLSPLNFMWLSIVQLHLINYILCQYSMPLRDTLALAFLSDLWILCQKVSFTFSMETLFLNFYFPMVFFQRSLFLYYGFVRAFKVY